MDGDQEAVWAAVQATYAAFLAGDRTAIDANISPDATVYDAVALMAEKNIGALLVVESDRPVGMISERDYTRKVMLRGKKSINSATARSRPSCCASTAIAPRPHPAQRRPR